MKLILSLVALLGLGYAIWTVVDRYPNVQTQLSAILDTGRVHSLEVRYSASQIMERNRNHLLKDSRHRYLEPTLEFYPYLLMEVKYTSTGEKTREAVILWDLIDGEMVINTNHWEKTHGFGDCMTADTSVQEFKILNQLAKKEGTLDRNALAKALHVDYEILDHWIDSCRKKKLLIQAGNGYKLHFQNPNLRTTPETHIDERLVTQPLTEAVRLSRRFSARQVERLTKAAFGQNFAIRKKIDIYLPVHSIVVQNPDGSIHTSHWNALNGKRLSQSHFID